MKIHLVYANTPGENRIDSPFCVTNNLYNYLSKRAEIVYDVWTSTNIPNADPNAIFIGHPHYNENTIVQQVFRQNLNFKAKFSIHPFHYNHVEDNWPFNHIVQKANKYFAICGPYWYDTIENTVFKNWKPKMVRLDMAVDGNIWKHKKTEFNNPGKRGVVYVGSSYSHKNLGYLYEIVKKMPDTNFRWYGGSSDTALARLPNMQVIGWCDFHDQKILEEIYKFADIFLNVSISDANPTTLLEFGLAGGLIPICTQTSGYWNSSSFINISHCLNEAVAVINDWLTKPSIELEELSRYNRTICEKEYTWDKFCSTIWKEIEKFS